MIRVDANVPTLKRLTSRFFYWLSNAISDYRIEPGSSDFRLLDRRVVDVLRDIRERVALVMHRGLGQERVRDLEGLGIRTRAGLAAWSPERAFGLPFFDPTRGGGHLRHRHRRCELAGPLPRREPFDRPQGGDDDL